MTEELPHGWTLEDLVKIARHVARSHQARILDLEEARDIAAVGVVERLYADPPPTRMDLFRAARIAVGTANQRQISFRGLDRNPTRSGRTGTPPGFAAYWHGRGALVSPWEEGLVERIATRQVLAALKPLHREALTALAEHGSYEAAAAALGLSAKGWQTRIRKARIEARTLWHWPEEPAPQWATDHPGREPDARGRNGGLWVARRRRAARVQRAKEIA